jgi:hypothetical protein
VVPGGGRKILTLTLTRERRQALTALSAHCGSQNPKLQLGALTGHCEFCVQGLHVVPDVALS